MANNSTFHWFQLDWIDPELFSEPREQMVPKLLWVTTPSQNKFQILIEANRPKNLIQGPFPITSFFKNHFMTPFGVTTHRWGTRCEPFPSTCRRRTETRKSKFQIYDCCYQFPRVIQNKQLTKTNDDAHSRCFILCVYLSERLIAVEISSVSRFLFWLPNFFSSEGISLGTQWLVVWGGLGWSGEEEKTTAIRRISHASVGRNGQRDSKQRGGKKKRNEQTKQK